MNSSSRDIRDPQTYAIIGAAMEVHRVLGGGFLENVYKEALTIELVQRGIPFQREAELPIFYKGIILPCLYRADFVCYDSIIIENKSIKLLTDIERAQIINYLKATQIGRALLINFGPPTLEFERFINTPSLSVSSVPSVVKSIS